MPINAQALIDHRFEPINQSYTARDTILYALGLGLGSDPLDDDDLDYLLEPRGKVLPSFAATLGSPGMWIRDPRFGVDFERLVHAEQWMTFASALPAEGHVAATPRIAGLFDRGEGRGAVLVVERDILDAKKGGHIATARQTLLLRGDGGFGGEPPPTPIAEGGGDTVDCEVNVQVSRRAALIYQLSGDWNPLHSDPVFAARAGFARPILHGLASYGIAGRAAMRAFGADLAVLSCRFAGVVYPGDLLRFRFRRRGDSVSFVAGVDERIVLDRGLATLR
jgi:acyl dehydratase